MRVLFLGSNLRGLDQSNVYAFAYVLMQPLVPLETSLRRVEPIRPSTLFSTHTKKKSLNHEPKTLLPDRSSDHVAHKHNERLK